MSDAEMCFFEESTVTVLLGSSCASAPESRPWVQGIFEWIRKEIAGDHSAPLLTSVARKYVRVPNLTMSTVFCMSFGGSASEGFSRASSSCVAAAFYLRMRSAFGEPQTIRDRLLNADLVRHDLFTCKRSFLELLGMHTRQLSET